MLGQNAQGEIGVPRDEARERRNQGRIRPAVRILPDAEQVHAAGKHAEDDDRHIDGKDDADLLVHRQVVSEMRVIHAAAITIIAKPLRALGATSQNGINAIHYLDGSDNGLGQSPLLAPSVFNFFSPNFRQPGAVAQAGLYSPEFQITTETSVVGSLNFFSSLFNDEGYGGGASRLSINLGALQSLAAVPVSLVERIDALLFAYQMSTSTRTRLLQMVATLPGASDYDKRNRVKAALIVTAMSPDFVIQK